MEAKSWLYVCECEQGKYYIGITNNLNIRFGQHLEGEGSSYTSKYLPRKLTEVSELKSKFEEDMKVKEYMDKYGISNVRGGTYSQEVLTGEQISFLQKELDHANGKCFTCGGIGHYAYQCVNNKIEKKEVIVCERCDRYGHAIGKCFAEKNKNNAKLCKGKTKKGTLCSRKIDDCYEFCTVHK